jgi:hypothetical protein
MSNSNYQTKILGQGGRGDSVIYLIDGFMIKLEKKPGMALRKKKVGRPRKVKLQQVFKNQGAVPI